MWTQDELSEIRHRATVEASVPGISDDWADACRALASAATNLAAFTADVEAGIRSACAKPRLANVAQTTDPSLRQKLFRERESF